MDEQKKEGQNMGENASTEAQTEAQTPTVLNETPISEETPATPSVAAGATPPVEEKKNSHLLVIGVVVAVVVLGALYYFVGTGDSVTETSEEVSATQNEVDPESVVARVNNVEILGEALMYQLVQVAQVAGIPSLDAVDGETFELMKAQAIEAIINTEVLVQAATGDGISVSKDEVNSEFASIVESIGGAEVAAERLQILGITEDEFKENLTSDLLIQKYLEINADESVLTVTEEEIQAFYDQVTAGQTEGMPTLDEARFQIEEQLSFQKEQDALQTLLEDLRVAADIEIVN